MAVRLLAGAPFDNESSRAMQACNDWLRLGPGRTLPKLLKKYGDRRRKSESPTDSYNTLEKWSSDYAWPVRAGEYDAELEEQKNLRRRKELETGLALDNERVRKLKRLAKFLEDQIFEEGEPRVAVIDGPDGTTLLEIQPISKYPSVWVRDVKQVGAEKVEIVRFNAAILSEFRGVLDDLAKEVGGRKQKVDHEGGLTITQMTRAEWEKQRQGNRQQVTQALQDAEDE